MKNVLNYHELIEREPIQVSLNQALGYLKGKRVLVTGAGGSIGSELCKQIVFSGASRLYLFGHGENSIYKIQQELLAINQRRMPYDEIIPVIGELQDAEYMVHIMHELKADVVFHTAAHKHVPLTEANPVEAIKNNVFGTLNIVNACKLNGVEKFVLISTDKAVEPICVYGASKRLAEEIVLRENNNKYLVVRFGNVLGSKGSVIPLFKKQILSGGPVTITHPDISRYFITIPEAVSLVLKIGGVGNGGAMYLLDMGSPIKIVDIANRLMSQLNKQVNIVYTGLRSGDKISESLCAENEIEKNTKYRGIISIECLTKMTNLYKIIKRLYPICYFDCDAFDSYRSREVLSDVLKETFETLKDVNYEEGY